MPGLFREVLRKGCLRIGILEVLEEPKDQVRAVLLRIPVVGEDGNLGRGVGVDPLGDVDAIIGHSASPLGETHPRSDGPRSGDGALSFVGVTRENGNETHRVKSGRTGSRIWAV